MACFSPLAAWKPLGGGPVLFSESKDCREIELPCGQCVGCRLERSRQWAMRCLHESSLYDENCFITLTYEDSKLPQYGSLRYYDYQCFMKRLRKALGRPVRFYMCGEYGENFGRPHYHACIFGWRPRDLVLHSDRANGCKLYTSAFLSRIWTDGFASVGELSFESAAYVARYIMKKVTGPRAESHYAKLSLETGEIYNVVPEFTRMSLKPGIGRGWFDKYAGDVYPHDEVAVNGRWVKPPKFYDKLFRERAPLEWECIEFDRYKAALSVADDNSYDRLRVREVCTRARLSQFKRSLE